MSTKKSQWKVTGAVSKGVRHVSTEIVEPEPAEKKKWPKFDMTPLVDKADKVDTDAPDVAAFIARWAGRYSERNLRLLWVQRPGATRLHTFNGWIMQGRIVTKGEKAIRLFAPHARNDPEKASDENPDGTVITRVRPIALFDISQTHPAGQAAEAT